MDGWSMMSYLNPKFIALIGYHIFLTMVLFACAFSYQAVPFDKRLFHKRYEG